VVSSQPKSNISNVARPAVAIFGFNRPEHLRKCLESLFRNQNSTEHKYFLFIDGPRTSEDVNSVEAVCEVGNFFKSKLDIAIVESPYNRGLSESLISGISEVLTISDSIIVIEDDLELHPNFLNFMSKYLSKYKNDDEVASIQGFTYPIFPNGIECFFLKGADCWGWGTWRDRWALLQLNSQVMVDQLKSRGQARSFDLDGAFPYTRMLERQARGEVDSWAIRWHASIYLLGKLSLYPPHTLVRNNGFDGSGTHVSSRDQENFQNFSEFSYQAPVEIRESKSARHRLKLFLRKKYGTYPVFHPKGIVSKIQRRIIPGLR